MNNNPFERSLLTALMLIGILTSFILACLFIVVNFTIDATTIFLIFLYSGSLLIFASICSLPIIQLMTKYTDTHIEQPSIFGPKFLSWHDVREIRNITTGHIILVSFDTKININLFLFKNPQRLLAEIRSRIPDYAYPSDIQINKEIYRQKQNYSGRSAIVAFISAVVTFIIGKNIFALIFGLLIIAFAIYQIRNWLKYKRLQQ